mmetsp:Transcript_16561/g.32331  ORF Transcript_16561/g.32331 Transcript_16561/m.32331 type:complete len:260 (+) Transcript_16561:867-1646(+)
MHRHVVEDSSTALHILIRRWGRITGAGLHNNRVTNFFLLNRPTDTQKIGIKPPLQTNHQFHPGLVTSIDGFHSLSKIGSNGLLAENVFSIGGTCLNLIGMKLRRGADPYGIDFWVCDDLHGVGSEFGNAVFLSSILGFGDGRVRYNYWDHSRSLVDGSQVNDANASTTDNSNFDGVTGTAFSGGHAQRRRFCLSMLQVRRSKSCRRSGKQKRSDNEYEACHVAGDNEKRRFFCRYYFSSVSTDLPAMYISVVRYEKTCV